MRKHARTFLLRWVLPLLIMGLLPACSSGHGAEDTLATTESLPPETSNTPTLEETSLETETIKGYEGYVVMRGDSADKVEIDAAVLLFKSFANIDLTTDWVKRGESVPETGKELLVGVTNRPETREAMEGLLYADYTIVTKGERVVIVGGSPSATYEAVVHFLKDQSDYTYRHDYAFTDPKINSNPLENYVIRVPTNDNFGGQDLAAYLQNYFIANCGIALPIKTSDSAESEYEIRIGIDETLPEFGFFYGFDDSGRNLLIHGADRLGFSCANMNFKNLIADLAELKLDASINKKGVGVYQAAEFYVNAAVGKDSNDGSRDKPFASVKAMLEAVSTLTATAPYEITVYFADGVYPITETIKFHSEGVGANCAKLSFKSEDNASPTITALRPVHDFSETTVNGVKAWVADMPDDLPYTHQVFSADGTRLMRPRFPEESMLRVAGHPTDKNPFRAQNLPVTAMCFKRGQLPEFSRVKDILVRAFHYWTDEMLEVQAIDYEDRSIYFTGSSIYALKSTTSSGGANYYLDNVFEALNDPGEFYVDRETKQLYYIQQVDEKIGETTLYLSAPIEMLHIDGVDNLSFEGITFEGSDWTTTTRSFSQAAVDIPCSINLTNSDYVRFHDCSFVHIGHSALQIDSGCSNIDITYCTFKDLGAGAIVIRGTNAYPIHPDVTVHDIRISDCLIESYGRVYTNAAGINLMYAYDSTISHNEIHDGYQCGISCGWIWGYDPHVTDNITIEYNHIYNIGQGKLSDMGGIYTLGTQENTVIRNNLIHDVQAESYGGWGIYLDQGSSGILIENNICYDFSDQPFHQHYGKDNLVRNNIFAFGNLSQFFITKKEIHSSLTLEGNILLSNGAPIYGKDFSEMNFVCGQNLVWAYAKNATGGPADLVADPLFRAAKMYDFTLTDDSPAIAMGFEPIDMTEVGIR